MQIKVLVETEVHPTEDEGKVTQAVTNLTGSGSFKKVQIGRRAYLTQEVGEEFLSAFRSLLRRERILDAARKILLRGTDEEASRITFFVNKQVAITGHLSFCMPEGESPMGPISFAIETGNPKSLIEWLATRTIDGTPVDELCQSGSQHSAHSERRSRR